MTPRLAKSFRCAFAGIAALFRTQANARIHLVVTALAIAAGWFFRISPGEWIAILLSIGSVLAAEAMNSALEFLADATHPDPHPLVGRAKDIAAAAVLILAGTAVTVGAIVFVPRVLALLD